MTTTDKDRLEALRGRIEGVLVDPSTSPRDLATCGREYRLLLAAISEHSGTTAGSRLDEIAKRRAERGAS